MVSAEWEQCQASANKFFTKGQAKSTLKSYQSGIRRYESFCGKLNRLTLPAREQTLSAFVVALAKEGVSHTSLKVYLAAVRYNQIQNGQGNPGILQMVRLEYIMKGIRRDGPQSLILGGNDSQSHLHFSGSFVQYGRDEQIRGIPKYYGLLHA